MIDEEKNHEEVDETIEDLPEIEEGQEDTTDYKALAQKMQGMAKRFQTRMKKLSEKAAEAKPEAKTEVKADKGKQEVLDRIDRAVLSVKGITEPEEIELVERRKAETGRPLEDLLDSSWFKQELKELRDSNLSFTAMPKGSRRSGQAARDSVEYWIQKGELPPRNQVQLRRDVVNAKMHRQKQGNVFTDDPVV